MSQLHDPNEADTLVQKIVKKDQELSKKFAFYWSDRLQIHKYKNSTNFFDYSCNGLIWLVGLIAFAYFSNNYYIELEVNLFMTLIIDIIVVAVIKALVQRDRPSYSDIHPFNLDSTVFSFPSGFSSRATLIFLFFTVFYPLPIIMWIPLFAWFFSICITRVLLRKHFILDVLGGLAIALLEGIIISYIWIDKGTAISLFNWISDEKTVGSDAEVL